MRQSKENPNGKITTLLTAEDYAEKQYWNLLNLELFKLYDLYFNLNFFHFSAFFHCARASVLFGQEIKFLKLFMKR